MTAAMKHRAAALFAMLPAVALAGCGGSPAPAPTAKPMEKAVYISAKDCIESGKAKKEQCESLIDSAVAEHESKAPSYTSQASCEKVEGEEQCERTGNKSFRPRLIAFLVTFSEPPSSVPLYASKTEEPGFRTGKTTILVSDETYSFSRLSLASAEAFQKTGG